MNNINKNIPDIKMVRLHEDHIDGIIDLMNKEGWYYYDHHELKRYLNLDQECFVLLKNDSVAGSIFTTNYGIQTWIGNIVISSEFRGMGLAAMLIRKVINSLQGKIHTFRLGSVPLAIGLYKKMGFHPEGFTTSQEVELPLKIDYGKNNLSNNIKIEKMSPDDLKEVSKIDENYFKSNRLQFLTDLYNDSIKESCLCLKDLGKIVGFLMIRRRQTSKVDGGFVEGPDYAYRLGPSCILPEYGLNGFKALFEEAIQYVNNEVQKLGGSSRMYIVFPKNADKLEVYKDTRELAGLMEMDTKIDLDKVFDDHVHIFNAPKSTKNDEQWKYMEKMGFHQEYFEQVMSYNPEKTHLAQVNQRNSEESKTDIEGIFASATPGDKA